MSLARKSLTLPSGKTTEIRALTPIDCAVLGKYPTTIADDKGGDDDEEKEPTPEQREHIIGIQKLCLYAGCGLIIGKDGRAELLVDKPFYALNKPKPKTHTEICIAELDQRDCDLIISEVLALTGLRKEAAVKAATFPEGQADGSGSSSNS